MPHTKPYQSETAGNIVLREKIRENFCHARDNYESKTHRWALAQAAKAHLFVAIFEGALSMLLFYFKNRFIPPNSIFVSAAPNSK